MPNTWLGNHNNFNDNNSIILPTTKVKVIIIGNKIKLVIFYYSSGEPISYKPVEIFLVNLGPIIPSQLPP